MANAEAAADRPAAESLESTDTAAAPIPTSLSEVISEQLTLAASAASKASRACMQHYEDNISTRLAVWAAGAAGAFVFLQSPVQNTISLVSGILSLAIYAVVALALVAAVAHQIHRSEHAGAVQQLRAASSPAIPVPVPQRLPQEQSMSPAEIFTQRWKLPRAVVSKLGKQQAAAHM